MEHFNFYLLDTFTGKGLSGNPTPVCVLEKPLSETKMKSLAREFNCPVSAFVYQKEQGKANSYQIRYFTVTGEIPACGHASLGAAYVLFKEHEHSHSIKFTTVENISLLASREDETTFIQYPKFPKKDIDPHPQINQALGIHDFKSYFLCEELESLFIEVEHEEEVRTTKPDFEKLVQSTDEFKEVVVMSKSEDPSFDFALRSFCPWIGIDEDPVTGSIHSVLGHFWKDRLGKESLIAKQTSERGGRVIVKSFNHGVKIGGDCVITQEGNSMNDL